MESRSHSPGVGQRRVGKNTAEGCAKIRVTAEFTRGGKPDQDWQDNKSGRTTHIEDQVDGVARLDPAVGFHHPQQSHQQAGGDDRRNNGHKDVRQQAGDPLERIQFFRRQVCGFGFARLANTGRLNKSGIHFIDHAGTEDDLHLAGVTKAAFYPLNFTDGLLVGERVIGQYQTQAGGAVRGAGDIFFAAEQRQQRARNLLKIHSTLYKVCHHHGLLGAWNAPNGRFANFAKTF